MTMLRIMVGEVGRDALPAIDVVAPGVVIGSGPEAQVRLPVQAAAPAHVVLDDGRWRALAPVTADGRACVAGDSGPIAAVVTLELGGYRVVIAPAPPGTAASPPQRTESLARELVRGLLGQGAGPSFTIVHGPGAGATRLLPPPEATLVLGRGDEATWVILDEDLSRVHAEIRSGWDGVTVTDLGSRNGTRIGGARITGPTTLHDGDVIELGTTQLRFDDPAERHLRGAPPSVRSPDAQPPVTREVLDERDVVSPASQATIAVAVLIAALAAIGMVWILTT